MSEASVDAPTLRGSTALFTFRGIRVFLHWTFLFLVIYVAYSGYSEGRDLQSILIMLGMVLLVFVCVVLHEFGHALMAQRYGIHTRDITLLPIGGVASLERMPEEPVKEFWITVAGPAVNLVISALALIVLVLAGIPITPPADMMAASDWSEVLLMLMFVNLWLFLFNLIPAFPMDGGRIVRSVLGMLIPRDKATRFAALLGRTLAIGFVLVGFLIGHFFLALIGVFIFFAAGAESKMVAQRTALRGITVGHVMRTRFWSMDHRSTLEQAIAELLAGGDHDLLVTDADKVLGVLTRRDLVHALDQGEKGRLLADLAPTQVPGISPTAQVNEGYHTLINGRHPLLPVIHEGRIVGILEPDNLAEFLMVRGTRSWASNTGERP